MNARRVSVDAAALAALVEYADGERLLVDSEFCVNQSELDASESKFAALVAALDLASGAA